MTASQVSWRFPCTSHSADIIWLQVDDHFLPSHTWAVHDVTDKENGLLACFVCYSLWLRLCLTKFMTGELHVKPGLFFPTHWLGLSNGSVYLPVFNLRMCDRHLFPAVTSRQELALIGLFDCFINELAPVRGFGGWVGANWRLNLFKPHFSGNVRKLNKNGDRWASVLYSIYRSIFTLFLCKSCCPPPLHFNRTL